MTALLDVLSAQERVVSELSWEQSHTANGGDG